MAAIKLTLISTTPAIEKSFVLSPKGQSSVTIGRASISGGEEVTPDNGLIHCSVMSRNHAQFSLEGNKIRLRDLASTHGTSVVPHDGMLTVVVDSKGVMIEDGDVCTFGKAVARGSPDEDFVLETIQPITMHIHLQPLNEQDGAYGMLDFGEDVIPDQLSHTPDAEAHASSPPPDLDAQPDRQSALSEDELAVGFDLDTAPLSIIRQEIQQRPVAIIDTEEGHGDEPPDLSEVSSDANTSSDNELPSPPLLSMPAFGRKTASEISIDLSRDASPALSHASSIWDRATTEAQEIHLSGLREEYAMSDVEDAGVPFDQSFVGRYTIKEPSVISWAPIGGSILASAVQGRAGQSATDSEPDTEEYGGVGSHHLPTKRSLQEMHGEDEPDVSPNTTRPVKRLRRAIELGAAASVGAVVGAAAAVYALATYNGEL